MFRRGLIALLVLLALLGYLLWQALGASKIEFLRPSRDGRWIVHPAPACGFISPVSCSDSMFSHRFVMEHVPARYPVSITALGQFTAVVNGTPLKPPPAGRSWKRATEYDLATLLQAGENELRVFVHAPYSPPALLVQGLPEIRSDRRWSVSLRRERQPDQVLSIDAAQYVPDAVPVVYPYEGEAFMARQPGAMSRADTSKWWRAVWIGYGAFLLYALVPARFKPWMKTPITALAQPRRPVLLSSALCVALFVPVAVVQVRSALKVTCPEAYYRDWYAHVEYYKYLAERQCLPLASEGWEMFQPPLYYACAAAVYRVAGEAEGAGDAGAQRAVQVFSCGSGLVNLLLAGVLLHLLLPDRLAARVLGFAVAAMLGLGFYLNPMVTNEVFAGAVIGLAVLVVARFGTQPDLRWREAVLIGLACSLGLLAKYTGLFVFVALLFFLALRAVQHRLKWGPALLLLGLVLALSGWFYVRNTMLYGDPFVGNWDALDGMHYEHPPGYRTFGFFARFGSILTDVPDRATFASFWDGIYATLWTNAFRYAWSFPEQGTNLAFMEGLMLRLALLPTLAILLGLGRAVWSLICGRWDQPCFILVMTTVLTFVSILSFTMELPFFTTVKAWYFTSLLGCSAVFAGLGMETIARNLGRLRWLAYVNLGAVYCLVASLYWYRETPL